MDCHTAADVVLTAAMKAACKSNKIVLRLHDTVEDNDDIRFEDLESIFGLDVRRTFPHMWSTGPANSPCHF